MTQQDKTPLHIKLDEYNHVEKLLLAQFDGLRLRHNHPHIRPAHRQEACHDFDDPSQ